VLEIYRISAGFPQDERFGVISQRGSAATERGGAAQSRAESSESRRPLDSRLSTLDYIPRGFVAVSDESGM
jgi:hypothetical protein